MNLVYSTNTLCFEAINRVFRNSVVRHIRESLTAAFPDEWRDKLKSPFQKEWNKILSDAHLRTETGELTRGAIDEFDVLGVNHFYNLFEKYFEELIPKSRFTTNRDQIRSAILGYCRQVKVLRDPALGHPAESDMDPKDAMAMLDAARRLLNFFDTESATKIDEHYNAIAVQVTQTPREPSPTRIVPGQNFPSRETIAPSFIGRQEELNRLHSWLEDPHSHVWLLAGDGGKGKTAIAYEFAIGVCNEPPPTLESVIWLSGKLRKFEEGQRIQIEAPDFWDLESALDRILDAQGAITDSEMDIPAKADMAVEYLRLLPALIVLDDIDSLSQQNEDVLDFFLHRTVGLGSKVLLTSRRVPFGMGTRHIQVTGFPIQGNEGIKFIDSRIALFRLSPTTFSTQLKRSVLEACDGSPLFIQDLLRLCLVGESPTRAVELWKGKDGEEVRSYALGRELDMLSVNAKRLLLTCALFEGPISLPEIQAITQFSRDICHSCIQELQKIFLLPEPSLTEETPRFDLNSNTRQLVRELQGQTDEAQRLTSSIRAILGKTEPTYAHRKQVGQYIRQAVSQVKLSQHEYAVETLQQALEVFPNNPDLFGCLGLVYKSWRPQARYTDAQRYFSQAADLNSAKEDTYRHWSDMERERREWTAAATAAERGLSRISNSHRLAYQAGFSRSQLAKDLLQQTQYGRAEEEARKAGELLQRALKDVEELQGGEYNSHSLTHRAIVLNYEILIRICNFRRDEGGAQHFRRLLIQALKRWESEHPNDPDAKSEGRRLAVRHFDVS